MFEKELELFLIFINQIKNIESSCIALSKTNNITIEKHSKFDVDFGKYNSILLIRKTDFFLSFHFIGETMTAFFYDLTDNRFSYIEDKNQQNKFVDISNERAYEIFKNEYEKQTDLNISLFFQEVIISIM